MASSWPRSDRDSFAPLIRTPAVYCLSMTADRRSGLRPFHRECGPPGREDVARRVRRGRARPTGGTATRGRSAALDRRAHAHRAQLSTGKRAVHLLMVGHTWPPVFEDPKSWPDPASWTDFANRVRPAHDRQVVDMTAGSASDEGRLRACGPGTRTVRCSIASGDGPCRGWPNPSASGKGLVQPRDAARPYAGDAGSQSSPRAVRGRHRRERRQPRSTATWRSTSATRCRRPRPRTHVVTSVRAPSRRSLMTGETVESRTSGTLSSPSLAT